MTLVGFPALVSVTVVVIGAAEATMPASKKNEISLTISPSRVLSTKPAQQVLLIFPASCVANVFEGCPPASDRKEHARLHHQWPLLRNPVRHLLYPVLVRMRSACASWWNAWRLAATSANHCAKSSYFSSLSITPSKRPILKFTSKRLESVSLIGRRAMIRRSTRSSG